MSSFILSESRALAVIAMAIFIPIPCTRYPLRKYTYQYT